MLPHVLNEFSKAGIQPEIFKYFCQEVTEKRFPMLVFVFCGEIYPKHTTTVTKQDVQGI